MQAPFQTPAFLKKNPKLQKTPTTRKKKNQKIGGMFLIVQSLFTWGKTGYFSFHLFAKDVRL